MAVLCNDFAHLYTIQSSDHISMHAPVGGKYSPIIRNVLLPPSLPMSQRVCWKGIFRLAFANRQLVCVRGRPRFWRTASGLGNTPLTSGKLDSCPAAPPRHCAGTAPTRSHITGGVGASYYRENLWCFSASGIEVCNSGFPLRLKCFKCNLALPYWFVLMLQKEIWNTAAAKLCDSREVLKGVQISHARGRECFVHTQLISHCAHFLWLTKYPEEIHCIPHIAKLMSRSGGSCHNHELCDDKLHFVFSLQCWVERIYLFIYFGSHNDSIVNMWFMPLWPFELRDQNHRLGVKMPFRWGLLSVQCTYKDDAVVRKTKPCSSHDYFEQIWT